MLGGFADFYAFVPAFFSLVLAGTLLGLAYQRTGNLYFSIGLHAGWIFWLKTYGAFTASAPHATTCFWGTGKMVDGWLAFVVLAATLALFKFLPLKRKSEPFSIPR
jgi:membrane protease YdiL (CAAX protease family)